MMDHKNWTAIGIRYAPESMRPFVELLTIAASKSPIVIASWYAPTMDPRIHLGAVSLWYMGTDVMSAVCQNECEDIRSYSELR
jgi:hypothetical protein